MPIIPRTNKPPLSPLLTLVRAKGRHLGRQCEVPWPLNWARSYLIDAWYNSLKATARESFIKWQLKSLLKRPTDGTFFQGRQAYASGNKSLASKESRALQASRTKVHNCLLPEQHLLGVTGQVAM